MAITISAVEKDELFNNQTSLRTEITENIVRDIETSSLSELIANSKKLETLWDSFNDNHRKLLQYPQLSNDAYFVNRIYPDVHLNVTRARQRIISLLIEKGHLPSRESLLYSRSYEMINDIQDIANKIEQTKHAELHFCFKKLGFLWQEVYLLYEILLESAKIRGTECLLSDTFDRTTEKVNTTKELICALLNAQAAGFSIPYPVQSLTEVECKPTERRVYVNYLVSEFFSSVNNLERQLKNVHLLRCKSALRGKLSYLEREHNNIKWLYGMIFAQELDRGKEINEAFTNIEAQYASVKTENERKLEASAVRKREKTLRNSGNERPGIYYVAKKRVREDDDLTNMVSNLRLNRRK